MEKNLVTEAERYLSSQHKDKRRSQVLRIVAVLVVLATIYALILPAVTMSNEVECGMEEHIHTDSCWQEQLAWPEPELACAAQQPGMVLLHTHDSNCYNSRGELACTLPEQEAHVHDGSCYREQRTLACGQAADPGHRHGASCYTYVRVEGAQAEGAGGYACGFEEGEGAHQHTEACYPEERAAEPLCGLEEAGDEYDGEGNLVRQGHAHTEECWLVRVHEKLICGQEESEDEYGADGSLVRQGHRHSNSCWLAGDELCFQYGCGQHQSAGHAHSAACSQGSVQEDAQGGLWEQVLSCGEEERPAGHVHTDECYEVSLLFACLKEELAPHTHGEGCYGGDGALACGKPEAVAHQHTGECFVTPEGGQELSRTLVCGQEEHTHTEECYVKFTPKEEQIYYCGLQEHIHTVQECYFESGALRCTLTEHVHDLACLEPPVEEPQEPEEPEESGTPAGPEEPAQTAAEGVMLEDEEFVYSTETFTVSFHINGFAKVAGSGEEGQQPQDGDPAPLPTGVELVELTSQMVPLAAMPRMVPLAAFSDDSAPDSGAPPITEDGFDSMFEPGPDIGPGGTAVENSSQPALDTPVPEASAAPVPAPDAAPSGPEGLSQQWDVGFDVEVLDEDDPRMAPVLEKLRESQDMENSMFLGGLVLNVTLNGLPADTSACEITATVRPTQYVMDYVRQGEDSVMTLVEGEEAAGAEAAEAVHSVLSLAAANGQEVNVVLDSEEDGEEPAGEIQVYANEPVATYLNTQVYPNFWVEYYAYLGTVYTSGGPIDSEKPTLINTGKGGNGGGGNLPEINVTPPLLNMEVDDSGEVQTDADKGYTKKIFTDHLFNYASAPRLKHVDIVSRKESVGHYELAEIWMIGADGEPVAKYLYDPDNPRELTNNAKTAANSQGKYILIQNGCKIRLVYRTTSTTKEDEYKTVGANFFDYDITDGHTYSTNSASEANRVPRSGSGGEYIYTVDQGINSIANYTGEGVRFGFGNNDMKTPIGELEWQGQWINKGNGTRSEPRGYGGCSFKLVQDHLVGGKLVFNTGIDAPDLFGTPAHGSTAYTGSLTFKREGDTYTLVKSTVEDSDGTKKVLDGLDKLEDMKIPSWSFGFNLFSNSFWPLDSLKSAGKEGHDPMFGATKYIPIASVNDGKTTSASDNGKDHNAYFGMNFKVDFTLYDDYVGPLEYYFFGDDDMWVYLSRLDADGNAVDSRLICDIGGVHPSVGEYVNLWDWIKRDEREYVDVTNGNPNLITEGGTKYELTFFYTERGASGSTCWMQFTLPEMRGGSLRTPTSNEYGTLEVEKTVNGPPTDAEFSFRVKLTDGNGKPLADLLGRLYTSGGDSSDLTNVEGAVELDEEGYWYFTLQDRQSLLIKDLPAGTVYELEELDNTGYSTGFLIQDVDSLAENPSTSTREEAGTKVSGTVQGGHALRLLCTNSASYELPETGGAGSWYTMAGLPLAAAFCLWYKKKTRGEGGADEA